MDNNNEQEKILNGIQKNSIKTVKGKGLTVFIIVIVIMAMAISYGCGFVLGKQLYEMKDDADDEPYDYNHSETEVFSKAEELISTITDYNSINNDNSWQNPIVAYANNRTVYASELEHEIVYQVILNKYYSNNPQEISLNDFNNKVKQVFDETYSYVAKDYYDNCSGNSYKYDENEKKYYKVAKEYNCEREGNAYEPFEVLNAYTEDDNLIVEVQVLFGQSNNGVVNYYSDFDRTTKIDGATKENYNEYFDEGSLYIFTFKKSNDNYVFVKSELENE